MVIRILMLIFVSLCSSYKPVSAEPTPSITYLMSEPASLLDLGIFKLNMFLESSRILKEEGLVTSAAYDLGTN